MGDRVQKTKAALEKLAAERARLADQMAAMQNQEQELAARQAADLAQAAEADLVAVARAKAEAETDLRTLRLAMAELQRRLATLDDQLAAGRQKLRVYQAEAFQAELDRAMVNACKQLQGFVDLVRPLQMEAQDRSRKIGITPQLAFPTSFIELCELRIDRAVRERGLKL